MKKLRKNSGFTLIECVVAMAVFAVMTLGLFMILGVMVGQRNRNTQLERDIDSQIEQIVQGSGTASEEIEDGDIVFKEGDKDVFTISGAQRVYCDDDYALQIGALKYDASAGSCDYASVGYGKEELAAAIESRKVYGTADLEGITVSAAEPEDPVNGYYTVTWEIKFRTNTVKAYPADGIQSLKVVLPPNVNIIGYRTDYPDACPYIHLLGGNTVRMQPQRENTTINVYVTFMIKESEYKSYKGNAGKFIEDYFGDTEPELEPKYKPDD